MTASWPGTFDVPQKKASLMARSHLALTAAAMAAAMPHGAQADDFGDRLRKMPATQVSSAKTMASLEWCLGTGIGKWMPVSSLHGEDRLLVYGAPSGGAGIEAVYIMVQVVDTEQKRDIAFNAHKGWDDKTEALIRSCAKGESDER
ncbi:MAG: hypothetical protein VYD90_13000 [Pseudomonadota bacterium]|nr:hypothetical protein [Pseudomonadota bacterium]